MKEDNAIDIATKAVYQLSHGLASEESRPEFVYDLACNLLSEMGFKVKDTALGKNLVKDIKAIAETKGVWNK